MNVWPEQKQTFLHFNWILYQHPYLVAGGKKNKKNNSNYENLKPNLMECVIRIFMNFVLLSCDYVVSWSQCTITVNKKSGFLNRIF